MLDLATDNRTLSMQQLAQDMADEQYRINGYAEWLLLYPGYLSDSAAQKIREALGFSEVRLRLLDASYQHNEALFAHGYADRMRVYVPNEVLQELQGRLHAMQSVAHELVEIPQGSASVSDEMPVDAK